MEKTESPIHKHPLLTITRFLERLCEGCGHWGYIYGGYCCNELGCQNSVFHKECAESLPEINHSSHPDHPLKLLLSRQSSTCSHCQGSFQNGYFCSICDFKLDLSCARETGATLTLENTNVHEHPLELFNEAITSGGSDDVSCKTCNHIVSLSLLEQCYKCYQCQSVFHVICAKFFPEANHTSHAKHPLKLLTCGAPDYADNKCLLCGKESDQHLHHCDVCNFSICSLCMSNPPPLGVVSSTTHEHQLHLVPRHIDFTCNACGTQGDRSPYFCLQCNFMIHRECIDLPRVININRHDHRISYTRRLGHGKWQCRVCRKKVDGFYGAYSCSSKCSNYVVHSRCATRNDVWDMIELEGMPEEEEILPFQMIDDNTIKHFSHDHNLRINKEGMILHENTFCQACVFQICSEPFYSCEQCDFILHQKCANLPRKKRHVCDNQAFTLETNFEGGEFKCHLCNQRFTGFRYMPLTGVKCLDVRCGSISEPFPHGSHQHPLYYSNDMSKSCTACGERINRGRLSCDECDFNLDFKCALLPEKVMRHRYDDHPLFLSYGESSVDGEYWCEACEKKVNPKKWFYTCNDCGVTLHISCVVGDFSYAMPVSVRSSDAKVVFNASICRPLCIMCTSRCMPPSILQVTKAGVTVYFCSSKCLLNFMLTNGMKCFNK
ncbi:Zinc finger PHD-type [Arabidopsis suecica]|uniref:Zinc finger PHD-type n=1 Tax=Arabidopsis suecica TaxID=45249 RepID=A0A8T2BB44_ARASU|nr:Zinc finger PHD-type [Arabidopsis suecica]